jgi:hypothetical protein
LPQKANPGGFSESHFKQTSFSEAAHFPQKFIPSGFSNPQLEQIIVASPW